MCVSCNHRKTKYHSPMSNTEIIVPWHRTSKYHHSSQPRLYWCGYAHETQLQFQPWSLQGLHYDQLSNITDFRFSSQLSFDSSFLTRLKIYKATRGKRILQFNTQHFLEDAKCRRAKKNTYCLS